MKLSEKEIGMRKIKQEIGHSTCKLKDRGFDRPPESEEKKL